MNQNNLFDINPSFAHRKAWKPRVLKSKTHCIGTKSRLRTIGQSMAMAALKTTFSFGQTFVKFRFRLEELKSQVCYVMKAQTP